MIENAPLTGSVMVMVCGPSLWPGMAANIWLALVASSGALAVPTVTVSPGAKPVPSRTTGPPMTGSRGGLIESP